jgi:hypothetical protein
MYENVRVRARREKGKRTRRIIPNPTAEEILTL